MEMQRRITGQMNRIPTTVLILIALWAVLSSYVCRAQSDNPSETLQETESAEVNAEDAILPNTSNGEDSVDRGEVNAQTGDPHPISVNVQASQPPNVAVTIAARNPWWGIIEIVLTLSGIVTGVLVIVWKIAKQHESSFELQQEGKRAELRAALYSELLEGISDAMEKLVTVSTYTRLTPISISDYAHQVQQGYNPVAVKQRALEFVQLDSEMTTAIIRLIESFESYAIAVPEFEVFQVAFNSALHDARQAFNPLYQELLGWLPMDVPPQQLHEGPIALPPFVPGVPTNVQLRQISTLTDSYLNALDNIDSYVHDLRVEAQNSLLSGLYPSSKAPCRVPLEAAHLVITFENAETLKRHFREDTPWGHHVNEIEDNVRRGGLESCQ